jgi:hypothetical protein
MLRKANSDLASGTSLSGYLHAPRWLVERVFGEPHYKMSGDNKVTASWAFIIKGKVITIYDYKMGSAADSPEFSEWHLGSHIRHAIPALFEYLSTEMELDVSMDPDSLYPTICVDDSEFFGIIDDSEIER